MNIAGFLAGNDSYGTLLNFSLMSKRLRQESIPTLYETVIWHERSRAKHDKTVFNSTSVFYHTKCVPAGSCRQFRESLLSDFVALDTYTRCRRNSRTPNAVSRISVSILDNLFLSFPYSVRNSSCAKRACFIRPICSSMHLYTPILSQVYCRYRCVGSPWKLLLPDLIAQSWVYVEFSSTTKVLFYHPGWTKQCKPSITTPEGSM